MTSTPHDAFFKAVYSGPEHARGELRAIVPPVLVETLDWATLEAWADRLFLAATLSEVFAA